MADPISPKVYTSTSSVGLAAAVVTVALYYTHQTPPQEVLIALNALATGAFVFIAGYLAPHIPAAPQADPAPTAPPAVAVVVPPPAPAAPIAPAPPVTPPAVAPAPAMAPV